MKMSETARALVAAFVAAPADTADTFESKYGFLPPKTRAGRIAKFLNTEQLADVLGLSKKTLERLRRGGEGPPFVRFGGQIRYPVKAIEEWLDHALMTEDA